MKFSIPALQALSQKPPLYAPGDRDFWTDAHIAQQMLAYHLNPDTDAASRKPETIDETVKWLVNRLALPLQAEILDLGCGPGLYAERLARAGLKVTGVDQSSNSINYARRRAKEEGLPVEYHAQNYLEMSFRKRFEAALLIYYDFGPLSENARDTLLARTWLALKSGGRFIFDVLTPANRPAAMPEPSWSLAPAGGFWSAQPYLVFTQMFAYPEAQSFLDQYIVVEEDGKMTVFRSWEHTYTPETLTPVMERAGFVIEEIYSDLTGTPYQEKTVSLGIVAKKV